MAIYQVADINHDSTTKIPLSTSHVAPHGKQGTSYVELVILKDNVHPCTSSEVPTYAGVINFIHVTTSLHIFYLKVNILVFLGYDTYDH